MCYICISDLSFLLLTREKWIAQVAWQVCTFITHVDNGFVSVLGFPLMTRVTWMTVSQLTATYCFYGYTAEKLPANSLSVIPIKNHKGPTNIWRSYFSHIGIRWKIQSQKKLFVVTFTQYNKTFVRCSQTFPLLSLLFSTASLSLATESGEHKKCPL